MRMSIQALRRWLREAKQRGDPSEIAHVQEQIDERTNTAGTNVRAVQYTDTHPEWGVFQ